MTQSRGTAVLAMADTHAEEGRETRPVSIGTLPALGQLRKRILAAGFHFATLRSLDGRSAKPHYALWDFGSFAVLPRPLQHIPRRRVIAWSLESPLVAHRAYHRLEAIAGRSARILTFPGARNLLTDTASFRPLFYPNESRAVADNPPWRQRDFLVLISTNKTVRPSLRSIEPMHPYQSARRLAAGVLAASYRARGKWEAPDLYAERVKAIEHFSHREDFTLFGSGWSASGSGRVASAVARCHRGPVPDKHEALRGFRFALCFENTRFPGYITEKLFDCLYAGAIPIYLGAPDITDYVPTDVFIDPDRFRSLDRLERHLAEISQADADRYLDSAQEFLASPTARDFESERFVERMMTSLEDAARGD